MSTLHPVETAEAQGSGNTGCNLMLLVSDKPMQLSSDVSQGRTGTIWSLCVYRSCFIMEFINRSVMFRSDDLSENRKTMGTEKDK